MSGRAPRRKARRTATGRGRSPTRPTGGGETNSAMDLDQQGDAKFRGTYMGDRFAEELARDNAEWGARRRGEQVAVAPASARTPSEIRRARQRNIAQRNTAAPPKKSTLTPSHHRTPARSPSPTSSSASGGDFPSHYTTPGTSVAATPSDSAAHLLAPRRHTTRSRSKIGGTIHLMQTISTTAGSNLSAKRKRGSREESDESEGGVSVIEDLGARAIRALSVGDGENYDSRSVDDDEDEEYEDGGGVDEDSDYEDQPRAIAKPAVRAPRNRRPIRNAATTRPNTVSNPDQHSDSDLSSVPDGVSGLSENGSDIEEVDSTGQPGASTTSTQPTPTPVVPSRVHLTGRRLRAHIRGYNSRAIRDRFNLELQHPEIKTMWDNLEKTPVIKPEKALQPKNITRSLKPFQLEGLNWMVRQEKTPFNGGLLGDEMGMGKTIQAVSLIMSDYPAKSPTLVLVPPVALMQWQSEINDYTNGKLKVLVYHGQKKDKLSKADLRKHDVILVTYSGLEYTYRKEQKGVRRKDEEEEEVELVKADSLIHSVKWHRVILDEAHSIKTRVSNTSKACFALKANHKWCLSGTPLQNRIGELFSLLKFLEIKPFAYYLCVPAKRVVMVQRAGHTGEGQTAFGKLQLLLDRVMLRRLKKDHVSSMELPPKQVVIHREVFNEIELDLATSVMTNSTRQFDNYVAQGVVLNNYANIFGLIMQMRQVADHPDLLLKRHTEGGQNVLVCVICDDVAEDAIRSKCHHTFCRKCVRSFIGSFQAASVEPDCPRCHITLSIDLEQPETEQDELLVKKSSIINRIKMENWTSSTKIEMLVYDLYKLRSSKQTHKSIVFSQFTSMLQLIEWRLHRAGFKTVMLDGTMTPTQRASSIKHFMDNVDVEVFLVSLKAGGVALNLTEASRVFIVDPWWNPAAEWQSADRCHRIGQRRPCVITRLVIEDSVESRMVLLQEKKAKMINGTMNADQKAMESLTAEDMEFLFRGN
ncbi:MAG: DNA repair protein rad16 [Geoglossum simile]|nr:MAG: DNA repair protein rad16 [Geoglossum simile]